MRKKRVILELAAIAVAAALLFAVLAVAGAAAVPFGNGFGATWDSYRAEEPDSADVLYFGSSMVYCDVAPAVVYDETGLTGFVMAGPEQTMAITYYYVREALRTQSPQAVCVEVSGLLFARYEDFTMANLVQFPWGLNRLGAVLHGARTNEMAEALFPVLAYHERFYSADLDALRAQLSPEPDIHAGYTPLHGGTPPQGVSYRDDLGDEAYDDALVWLKKIAAYCREQGVTLVLYQAPSCKRPVPARQAQLERDAAALGDVFLDFNDPARFDALGLESGDWYDALHFNCLGAEKFSRALARELAALGVQPGAADEALWAQRLDAFYAA